MEIVDAVVKNEILPDVHLVLFRVFNIFGKLGCLTAMDCFNVQAFEYDKVTYLVRSS